MGTLPEDEALLDALVQGEREDPSPGKLEALERRLEPFMSTPRPRGFFASVGMRNTLLAALGLGLLAAPLYVMSTRSNAPVNATPAPVVAMPSVAEPASPSPSTESSVSVLDLPAAPVEPAAPKKERVAVARPSASVVTTTTPKVEEPSESEGSFLRRTQSTLVSDPARALAMTRDHSSLYPRGVLLQERDVIAIDALARLGRLAEARTRAAEFRAQYPKSAHLARIQTILGDER
ncbi:hypothetical protein [Labilithrix luteola]|nr:hypothetical protein [Labilithrix luteola]